MLPQNKKALPKLWDGP